MKKIFKEFKQFITRGNVIDLAVGMIIGAAFTAIVTAVVNNIFKPVINMIPLGDLSGAGLITMLVPKDANGNPDSTPAALAEAFRDGIPTETEADIEWAAYYKDPKVTAQPTSPAPDWVPKDANGNIIDKNDENGLVQAYKDSLPAPGTSEYEALSNTEKAWTSFLKDDPAGSPNPADEPELGQKRS